MNSTAPSRQYFGSLTSGRIRVGPSGSRNLFGIKASSAVLVPLITTSQRYRPALIQAGFPLVTEPGKNTRSGIRLILHGNAVFALKTLSQRITTIGAQWTDERELAFAFCRQ